MKRAATLIAVAVVLLSATSDAAEAGPQPCAGDMRAKCLVRPHRLFTGAHTWVRGIHWIAWNRRTALGFGKLIEPGGATYEGFTAPAKVRLSLPAECRGRNWFWSTTVTWGPAYGKPYLKNDTLVPC